MIEIVSLDDHPIFSCGLSESLKQFSEEFRVHPFTCPQKAFSHLKSNPQTDLLVLDLSMPEIDGISFMHGMANRGLITPVIVMSASEDIQLFQTALTMGALGVIPKSISAIEIASCLRLALKGEVVLPERVRRRLNEMSKFADENTETVLSSRQLEIVKMLYAGLSNSEIASVLFISEVTVKSHLQKIYKILDAKNRVDCLRKAEIMGILKK
ncbi:response regulator transcription factor [Alteromonas facilis]|uniref:response regulator transcription factor n=1 Tax=Alteromonas facilis TaxID=2048004 RepID=UPI000C286081|nr:response regulator transcription factor [Alteromonas facilis]